MLLLVLFLSFPLANLSGKVTPVGANKLIITEHGMNSSLGTEALCELVWHALKNGNCIGNPLKCFENKLNLHVNECLHPESAKNLHQACHLGIFREINKIQDLFYEPDLKAIALDSCDICSFLQDWRKSVGTPLMSKREKCSLWWTRCTLWPTRYTACIGTSARDIQDFVHAWAT